MHGAQGRFQQGAAGVAETLPGFQVGLLADHPFAPDFLNPAIGVGDDPMSVQEAGGRLAGILEGDGVSEGLTVLIRLGLLQNIYALGPDGNAVARVLIGWHGKES